MAKELILKARAHLLLNDDIPLAWLNHCPTPMEVEELFTIMFWMCNHSRVQAADKLLSAIHKSDAMRIANGEDYRESFRQRYPASHAGLVSEKLFGDKYVHVEEEQ